MPAADAAAAALSVQELRKTYGTVAAVDAVSFAVRAGECYALLGPNGAGKTSILRCCLGLTAFDAGAIHLLGYPVPVQARLARQRAGVVSQMDNLDPDFTVEENLVVYARYFGIDRHTIARRIPELLEFASLGQKVHARISELSGGMKRRLMLARALINDPSLILMDEPTTGLDPQARHLIWERLKQLLSRGKTILLTTHFMDEAERLADRIAILDSGRKIAEGSPRELIRAHIEPEVVEVFGEGAVQWARDHAPTMASRVEIAGETAFCYVTDATSVRRELEQRPQLRHLYRPANLEDVFLKLTGREMRAEW